MKRFVIVGLGNFGSALAEGLYTLGHDVVAVDLNETLVDRIAPHVSRAAVGDGRQVETLERIGARDADAGIVSTGDDITASILAAMALRDLNVSAIYVKVISRDHARVMARIGVSEVIFPERESALNLSHRLTSRNVFKYVQIGKGYSMQEMTVPDAWENESIRSLGLREKHDVAIIAVHDVLTGQMHVPPDPDAPLKDTDTLLVAGDDETLEKLAAMK